MTKITDTRAEIPSQQHDWVILSTLIETNVTKLPDAGRRVLDNCRTLERRMATGSPSGRLGAPLIGKKGNSRGAHPRQKGSAWMRMAFLVLYACWLLLNNPGFAAEETVANCLIEPDQIVDLGSPVTGLLREVLVRRADQVTEGQVVAKLESRAETASVELARFKSTQAGPTVMAESKIEFSQKKFNRRQAMAQEKVMSMQASDDAEAELRLAQSELKVAEENRQIAKLEYQQQKSLLDLRTIRSPFSGVVVEQLAWPGEVVEPGGGKGGILKLARLDPLRIHVVLPKGAFDKVAPRMRVEVFPEIPANKRYVAEVRSIDRLIDAASGTFVVILELPNPDLRIPAGVTCRAKFPGAPSFAVPSSQPSKPVTSPQAAR